MFESVFVVKPKHSADVPAAITTYLFDALALAVLSSALINLLLLDDTVPPDFYQQGSTLLQALNAVVYAIYALRLFLNRQVISQLRLLAKNDRAFWFPVAVLLTLALASTLWSSEPQIAMRRAIALGGTAMVGVFLALRYSLRQFLTLVLGLSAAFAISSIAMVILWPDKGMMHLSTVFSDMHEGRWRGIFVHKNHLGSLMAVGIVTATGFLSSNGKRTWAAAVVLLLCIGLLSAAESLTALLATGAALAAVAFVRILSGAAQGRRETLLTLCPLLLLALYVSIYQYARSEPEVSRIATPIDVTQPTAPTNVTAASFAEDRSAQPKPPRDGFSRDTSATGRLDIWRLCWGAIKLQPLRGYGYGTFWRSRGPAEIVWKKAAFPPHAHNGWIDLALQVGIPAMLLVAGWMLWLGLRLLCWVRNASCDEDRIAGSTLLGLWVCLNVINLAESVLFRQHEILSVLVFTIAAFTTLALRPDRNSTIQPTINN